MRTPWMSRTDRRRWKSAGNLIDLGNLMALWLEGEIASRPGYQPSTGPDEETDHLVPTLADLCRSGYITTDSQPGCSGPGADGAHWEQRAAVEGLVADDQVLHRLVAAAHAEHLIVRVTDYRPGARSNGEPLIVTTRNSAPVTAFGGRISRREMGVLWQGIDCRLYPLVAHGLYLTVAAPEYGPGGERLWPALARHTNSASC